MRRPALWGHDRPPRTVVVGNDGSQAARRALTRAADAAGPSGHVIVVVAVLPADPQADDAGTGPTPEQSSRLLAEAAVALGGHDVRVSTRVAEAEPAEALAEAARRVNAGLIVVGARGDSYIARAFRGSVGEKLIARAPCDLLVAR
jgi:nucleotide-binding universal stress UspA family protein